MLRSFTVFTAVPLFPVLCQINQFHSFPYYFFKIHLNIMLPFTPRSSKLSVPFRFPFHTLYAFLFCPILTSHTGLIKVTSHKNFYNFEVPTLNLESKTVRIPWCFLCFSSILPGKVLILRTLMQATTASFYTLPKSPLTVNQTFVPI